MFLKSVHLQDVRCLADAKLSFEIDKKTNRKWTLLVGDNGYGKSTILKAISLLMAGSEGLLDVLHNPDSWVRNGKDACTITGVITTATGQSRKIGLTIRRGQTKRAMLLENAKSLKRLDDALDHTNRSYLTVGYGAARHTHQSSGHGEDVFHHPRVQAVSTLFAEHATMIPFESWAMDLQPNQEAHGLQLIRETLEGLLPNVKFHGLDKKGRRLLFKTSDGIIPLDQLSGGYRSVVGFCGDLLYRITEIFGDYRDPLKARGLLLIDELGLHLHPKWQRVLTQFLTEKLPNLQIVATTNAPITAHQAGEGELYYLRRDRLREPPTLHQFEGSPNKLLLHQLIMSPVFGVETATSYEVEQERKERGKLQAKSSKTPTEKRRLQSLQSSLQQVADWERVPSNNDDKLNSLLARIDVKLGKQGTSTKRRSAKSKRGGPRGS